jgi:hypothetical protein
MVDMVDSSKHHDGQLLVRRKSDTDKVRVSKRNEISRRYEANAIKQSENELVSAKIDNRLVEETRVG